MEFILTVTWRNAAAIFLVMLLSLLVVATFIAILVLVARKPMRKYKYLDLAVFDWLEGHTTGWRNRFMLFITFLGKHQFLIPANVCLLLFFAVRGGSSGFPLRVVSIALSSLVLMLVLKQLFRRKRPLFPLINAVRGLSFPSGHAIMAVTFYGLILYIIYHSADNNLLRFFLTFAVVVLILLIGLSRVYLRVHYLSDVIAGFIIGSLWLWVCLLVLERVGHLFMT